jgi:hypothetical protein
MVQPTLRNIFQPSIPADKLMPFLKSNPARAVSITIDPADEDRAIEALTAEARKAGIKVQTIFVHFLRGAADFVQLCPNDSDTGPTLLLFAGLDNKFNDDDHEAKRRMVAQMIIDRRYGEYNLASDCSVIVLRGQYSRFSTAVENRFVQIEGK